MHVSYAGKDGNKRPNGRHKAGENNGFFSIFLIKIFRIRDLFFFEKKRVGPHEYFRSDFLAEQITDLIAQNSAESGKQNQ